MKSTVVYFITSMILLFFFSFMGRQEESWLPYRFFLGPDHCVIVPP